MVMRKMGWLLLLFISVGCGSKPDAPDISGRKGPNPEQIVFEQLRSGWVQLDSAAEILGEALQTANSRAIPKGEALNELRDLIDGAGASLADLADPPKDLDEVKTRFAEFDDHRLKAVEGANDALHATSDASELAFGLLEDPKFSKVTAIQDVADLLGEAKQNLSEAITTLGGKVEADGT
jgi:hypothetical protein